jgi:hypothetical protein
MNVSMIQSGILKRTMAIKKITEIFHIELGMAEALFKCKGIY